MTQESDYPFHTAVVDGERVAGIMFVAGNGRFYEFQDPDTHDDYERYVCPRTGGVMVHDGPLDATIKQTMGGRVKGMVAADRWAEFRTDYVDAPEEKTEAWESEWKRLNRDRQREMATP